MFLYFRCLGANKPSEVDPNLFVPLLSHSIFPARLKKFFRCGVPEKQNIDINENKQKHLDDLDGEITKLVENEKNYTSKLEKTIV